MYSYCRDVDGCLYKYLYECKYRHEFIHWCSTCTWYTGTYIYCRLYVFVMCVLRSSPILSCISTISCTQTVRLSGRRKERWFSSGRQVFSGQQQQYTSTHYPSELARLVSKTKYRSCCIWPSGARRESRSAIPFQGGAERTTGFASCGTEAARAGLRVTAPRRLGVENTSVTGHEELFIEGGELPTPARCEPCFPLKKMQAAHASAPAVNNASMCKHAQKISRPLPGQAAFDKSQNAKIRKTVIPQHTATTGGTIFPSICTYYWCVGDTGVGLLAASHSSCSLRKCALLRQP